MALPRSGLVLATLLTALATSGVAAAQSVPRAFCADRPGKGSPPCVLDQGRFQVEVGLADAAFSRGGGTTVDATSFGALELRLGLTASLEGQLSWTARQRIRTVDRASGAAETVSGAGDLGLAVRWSLRHPDGDGLSIALQPFIVAPTGSDGIGGGQWQGGVIAPVSIPLTGDWSLALSPQVAVRPNASGSGRHAGLSLTGGLGRSIGPFALGAELWVDVDDDPVDRVTAASFDLTASWATKTLPDMQFDASAYLGLNSATPDLELVVGVARRF